MSKKAELQPLQELLDSIQSRLDVLESKIGVATSPSKNKAAATPSPSPVSPVVPPPPPLTPDAPPAVKAYDVFLETSVAPLADACNALQGMQHMGQLLQDAWTSIRTIIIIASKAKKPENVPTELQPHLTETQTALEAIRKLRLDRQYDDHCKAILESCAALSWILISPTPVALVKEASSSTEFWSNRIRKTHKGSNDQQIAFCNALQTLLRDLISYITEYHKTGLEWNPRGVSLAEAAIVVSSSSYADTATMDVPLSPRPFVAKVSGGSGGISSLVAELESKRTADGSSAATGLKHVTRDQQTWRKEFKGDKKATVSVPIVKKEEKPVKKKLTSLPICEYQERGHKWVVEHQTSTQLTVEVTDPKQQVYMFNCNHVTLQIKGGKSKSVILDQCQNCQVVFETVLAACEVVRCQKIQIQTTGICPSFSIDQTEGCLVYLSKESVPITNFCTSQSTEMNVSFPDGEEQKEVPIPEQFVHKLVNGAVTSEVSDVYH